MRDAFEQGIDDVNRSVQGKDNKERAMVRVKVRFITERFVQRAFARKKQHRSEVQDRRRDQNKNELKKGPWLLAAPAIKNPSRHNQKEKEIYDPHHVHPIDAPT
jgi:hypothetical protein